MAFKPSWATIGGGTESPPSRATPVPASTPSKVEGTTAFSGCVKIGWELGGRRMGLVVVAEPRELAGGEVFFHSSQVDRAVELRDGSDVRGTCVPGGKSGLRVVGALVRNSVAAQGRPLAPGGALGAAEPVCHGCQGAAFPGGAPPLGSPPVAAAPARPMETEADDELDERWFGQISTHIVGVSHHDGKMADGEEVAFNGKMVMNAANEQVGWLPKELSPVLLPMIQRQSRGMHVEGVVPRGAKNKFKVPLDIQVFGLGPDADTIGKILDEVKRAAPQFAGLSVIRAPFPGGIRVVELADQKWADKKPNLKQILGEGRKPSASSSAASKKLDAEMEKIFDPPVPYDQAPEAQAPAGFQGRLLEHQKKALHWMAAREEQLTAADLLQRNMPCMWVRETSGGTVRYRSRITGTAVSDPPALPRGGVLADDMGMGKTATVVALLLARRGLTLVVSPLSVMASWKEHLQIFAPSLRVSVHHGAAARLNLSTQALTHYDVVLTTYQTLAQGSLSGVSWCRVVLDEAHEIRNPGTQQAKACAAVRAEIRWCVTGTPMFNGLSDLYGLVAFLRLEPFSEHKWWLRTIARPARVGNTKGFIRLAQLLGTFLLRRTKALEVKCADGSMRRVLPLPERKERIERVPFGEEQQALYDRFFKMAARRVQGLQDRGEVGGQVANILALLTHLRQVCCAPELLPRELLRGLVAEGGGAGSALEAALARMDKQRQNRLLQQVVEAEAMGGRGGAECPICMEELLSQDPCTTACAHLFHRSCLLDWLSSGQRHCPTCRQPCRPEDILALPEGGSEALGEVVLGPDLPPPPSAKLAWAEDWVMQRLADRKVVVFSHFVRLLATLAGRLEGRGLQVARLQGDVPAERRAETVRVFQSAEGPRVLLCSVKCAGLGVTLTRASAVLLLDPWWNRAVEEQAVDRVHRIGQDHEVEVVRLVSQGSVEEGMLAMQDLKREISDCALASHSRDGDVRKARLDVMLSVFKGPWVAASGGPAAGAARAKGGAAGGGRGKRTSGAEGTAKRRRRGDASA